MSQNRDITFDMMKGIGIILVIIGHLAHGFGWLVPAIYTFHMPLFFILSGYFYKEKKNYRTTAQRFQIVASTLFISNSNDHYIRDIGRSMATRPRKDMVLD